MMSRFRPILLSALLVSVVPPVIGGPRGLPPQEGILNFGKVNENLYRGAQPDTNAIANLKRLGIKTIINLRQPSHEWKAELAAAQAAGLVCTNFPLKGLGRPKPEQVRQVLAAISYLPAPVFIHCEHGCDRTGTIVACYRIERDQWTTENALKEADRYGMSKLERGMRSFVAEFGRWSPIPGGKPAETKP